MRLGSRKMCTFLTRRDPANVRATTKGADVFHGSYLHKNQPTRHLFVHDCTFTHMHAHMYTVDVLQLLSHMQRHTLANENTKWWNKC